MDTSHGEDKVQGFLLRKKQMAEIKPITCKKQGRRTRNRPIETLKFELSGRQFMSNQKPGDFQELKVECEARRTH